MIPFLNISITAAFRAFVITDCSWAGQPNHYTYSYYKDESKVLQYFGNMRYNLAVLQVLLLRLRWWRTTLNREIPSLPDTLQASMAWSMGLKSMVLGLGDFAELLRILQPKWNFSNPLVSCTVINYIFTFCTTNVFGCFCRITVQFYSLVPELDYIAHSSTQLSNHIQ